TDSVAHPLSVRFPALRVCACLCPCWAGLTARAETDVRGCISGCHWVVLDGILAVYQMGRARC
ncbi:hypothetical protein JMJ77_0003793, partial [Colletotrichum scovillei]